MRFKGRDIFKCRVPRSGLTYSTEFEWVLAAQWAHYKQEEFRELEGDEQSRIVAAYRCHMQAEAVVHHEMQRKMDRRNKPQPRRR